MANPKLKLYVWENVLYSGMVCVLAHSFEEAQGLMLDKDIIASQFLDSNPKVITKPEAFVVWGGSK